MKKLTSILLACVMLAACLMAGCVSIEVPVSGETASEAESEAPDGTDAGDTPQETVEAEPVTLDMKNYLRQLAHDHPDAAPEELCDLMLENPFFRMFWKESTEYYYPALNYEFQPEGIRDAYCIWDAMQGTHAVIYVFDLEEDTNPDELAKAIADNVDPYWTETPLPNTAAVEEAGKLLFAMYPDDMQPVTGELAEKARDLTDIFHTYLSEHPDAEPLEITDYFLSHQKIAEMYTQEAEPGKLTGFGDFEHQTEITGFDKGAKLEPMISPNTFICYVFHVPEKEDTGAFEQQLLDGANLVWNVCVAANTVITEIDGNYVLFMMCTE